MASLVIFDEFIKNVTNNVIKMSSDTFKVALCSATPSQDAWDQLADVTQIGASNGYPSAGQALVSAGWAETAASSGIWMFSSADVTFTASGGDIQTHRYAVLYSDTAAGDELVGYVDRGSAAVITNGNSRTWDIGANGWFQMTRA